MQALNSVTVVLTREGQRTIWDTETGEKATEGGETGVIPLKAMQHQEPKAGRSKVGFPGRALRRKVALPTSDFSFMTPIALRINLGCFKPPNVWSLVMAALGNQYRKCALFSSIWSLCKITEYLLLRSFGRIHPWDQMGKKLFMKLFLWKF